MSKQDQSMLNCYFHDFKMAKGSYQPRCRALTITPTSEHCRTCKFHKTEREFFDAQAMSLKRLKQIRFLKNKEE